MRKLFIFVCCVVFSMEGFALDLGSHLLDHETTISQYFEGSSATHKPSNLKHVDCVYVLNLAKRPYKWQSVVSQLEPYGVGLNRFNGVDGWAISKEKLNQFWKEQREASSSDIPAEYVKMRGKLGCILAHLSLIQDAYDRGYECIWLLQDDIEVLRDPKVMDQYVEELAEIDPNWGLLFTDLDMRSYDEAGTPRRCRCLTGAYRENQQVMPPVWYRQRKNINQDFQEIRMRYGFHSVLISRTGMEKILYYFKHVVLHTFFDVDVHFIKGLNKYGLRDAVISNSRDWGVSDCYENIPELKALPAPYNQLKEILPYNPHGWYANAEAMEELIRQYQPKVVVELGSWLGKSTRHIAKNLSEGGKVYAVDHWKGNYEHNNPERKDVYHLLPTLYEQFLSNVINQGLFDKIIPWKMSTLEAAERMKGENIQVDMVYVDAAHDEKAVYEDLCAWYPYVKDRGILCGDDWGWGENLPVQKAVKRFAAENNLRIFVPSWNFWVLLEKDRGELF